MPLGITLGVMAMLTNTALFLPFFGFILIIESASVIIQLTHKKILKRKLFLSTPIHHHFQGIGWPESQITMRFWIISGVMAILGLILFFMSRLI
jgi:phospho-N-acetylmuramoyl-pentapeptide-transferase